MQDTIERPYHHGDLRRALIETAMAMLQEGKGWQFTLREVARRAGVSHAAPYKHFPDKAALLTELALVGFDRLREAFDAAKPPDPASVKDELVAAARAYIRFGTANPALYRLMFSTEDKASNIHLSARALGAFEVLTALLARGQAAGVFRERPVQGQAAACWALCHGITMLAIEHLLLPEKVGAGAVEAALVTLFEGVAQD
jgi:AcrR family transcriptional regulator